MNDVPILERILQCWSSHYSLSCLTSLTLLDVPRLSANALAIATQLSRWTPSLIALKWQLYSPSPDVWVDRSVCEALCSLRSLERLDLNNMSIQSLQHLTLLSQLTSLSFTWSDSDRRNAKLTDLQVLRGMTRLRLLRCPTPLESVFGTPDIPTFVLWQHLDRLQSGGEGT